MESNGETWEGKELHYKKHGKIRRFKPMNIIIKPTENGDGDDADFH
jgi:hypothetical protein